MAQDTTTRQFLDYAGLSKFWTNIVNKFATKSDAVKFGTFAISDSANDATSRTITYSAVDTTKDAATIVLPGANESKAGLMSAEHYNTVQNIKVEIDKMTPFAGLKLDGKEVSLSDRKADIELVYNATGSGSNRKAYIELRDKIYPTEGAWSEIDEAEYTANSAKTEYYAWTNPLNKVVTYYKWSIADARGPVNSLGEPLMARAISSIDVTELVKSGFLLSSDVVVNPEGKAAGTYLVLTFATGEKGEGTDTTYINVTDLVELYEAGEGITITHVNTDADDVQTTGTIKLNAAKADTLGGIKTGYTNTGKTYAVVLDANNNAYVAVPWDDVEISVSSTGKNKENENYLTVDCQKTSENNVDTYAITVEAGAGLQRAEQFARSAVQTITGDNAYTEASVTETSDYAKTVKVKLTSAAETSLGFADSAVQTVTPGSNYVTSVVSNDTIDGQKSYAVDLAQSTKDSLGLADSAVQEITILGTKLTKGSNIYTDEQAKKALVLGSASNSNITSDETLATIESDVATATSTTKKPTVPTTAAVKSYVDTAIQTSDNAQATAIKNAIEALDSNISAKTAANAFNDATVAQQVYTSVQITDGKLVDVAAYSLKIKDITDFRPLTDAEINEICGVTA